MEWMTYEKFVKEGRAGVVETLEALGLDLPNDEGCRLSPGSRVHWVHPNNTKQYMANFEECMEMFKKEGFSSFEELLNIK